MGPALDHICRVCGQHECGRYSSTWQEYLLRERLCFTCGHFISSADQAGDNLVVVDRVMYVLGPDDPGTPDAWKGHGGRLFRLWFPGKGSIIHTNDLWCVGQIPEHLQVVFPDNAEFLTVRCEACGHSWRVHDEHDVCRVKGCGYTPCPR